MPYILPEERALIDKPIDYMISCLRSQDGGVAQLGEVNYAITRIVAGSLKPGVGWGYKSLSSAIAVLHDAAEEMRRRLLNPHEDAKATENGDVREYMK